MLKTAYINKMLKTAYINKILKTAYTPLEDIEQEIKKGKGYILHSPAKNYRQFSSVLI